MEGYKTFSRALKSLERDRGGSNSSSNFFNSQGELKSGTLGKTELSKK